jgi:hypothetical protein
MNAIHLVLAIEFPPEVGPADFDYSLCYLSRELAQPLAGQLAAEIGKHVSHGLGELQLSWMAGVYDQAQLLRPGFPVHRALAELTKAGAPTREPGAHVISFQALRGQAPLPELEPDRALLGGALVLIPFCLQGPLEALERASAELEEKLMEQGLADARTALMLNQALAAFCKRAPEHARLMTLNDLAAMCAAQLDNMELAPVWSVIESALYGTQPAQQHLNLSYDGHTARLLLPDLIETESCYQTLIFLRQTALLLRAHGIRCVFAADDAKRWEICEQYALQWSAETTKGTIELRVHRHPTLGLAWWNVMHAEQCVGRAIALMPDAQQALEIRLTT